MDFKRAYTSFKALYSMNDQTLNNFLASYDIYDYDWENEEQLIQSMGADYYNIVKQKLVDYYSVINHLCAIGEVEKMYIPPAMDLNVGITANQLLYEELQCRDIQAKPGDRLIDLGCGRGRVASHVADYVDASVFGINIDPTQIENAKTFDRTGLKGKTDFKVHDFNNLPLPFEDESFDGAYNIQAFSLVKDLDALMREVYRIVKPGARFSILDYVVLDKYDSTNPEHIELMKRIKPLLGAIGSPSPKKFEDALTKAGFQVVKSQDVSIDGHQAPLIAKADYYFTSAQSVIKVLTRLRVLPQHFNTLFERLTKDAQAFVEADQKCLVTTSYQIVAVKPMTKEVPIKADETPAIVVATPETTEPVADTTVTEVSKPEEQHVMEQPEQAN